MDGSQNIFGGQVNIALIHGFMAMFGAIAHALRAHREGSSKGITDFIILTLMSSFSGVIFYLVSVQFFHNDYMTLAMAGAGGFLGVEGLTFLANKLRDSLISTLGKK